MQVASAAMVFGLGTIAVLAACNRTPEASAALDSPAATPALDFKSSAKTDSYKIELKPVGTYKKGSSGFFEIVLTATADFHVNEEYPHNFTVSKDAVSIGVSYQADRMDRLSHPKSFTTEPCTPAPKDPEELKKHPQCVMRVMVPVKVDTAGLIKFAAFFAFGVCNKGTCLIEKQTLQLEAKAL